MACLTHTYVHFWVMQVQQRGLRAEKAALAAAAAAEQEWLSRPGVAGALGVEVPEASPVVSVTGIGV
jgi:hypothetical protein